MVFITPFLFPYRVDIMVLDMVCVSPFVFGYSTCLKLLLELSFPFDPLISVYNVPHLTFYRCGS